MPKSVQDYEREFLHEVMDKKYDRGTVTVEMYQKEVLDYMKKKMDGETLLKYSSKFLNDTANDVVQTVTSGSDRPLAKDKNLYPGDFLKGLLNKAAYPTNTVKKIAQSKVTTEQYVNYCNSIGNINEGSYKAQVENRMKSFKMIEGAKPGGNSFTRFFKKLFNINGYNEKMAAYENAKQSLKEFIGDNLTEEEFERHIKSDEPFSTSSFNKVAEPVVKEKVDLTNEINKNNNENVYVKEKNEPVREAQKDPLAKQ